MRQTAAITGAQFGDEGKGAVVLEYLKNADICVRYNGGNNAGHTLYDQNDKEVKVNIAPSGIILPHITNVIANGCVVDLEVLDDNIKGLETRLLISDAAHLIFPYHQLEDQLQEEAKKKKALGTTGKGIGPAYADKVKRTGIRAGMLRKPKELEERLREIVEIKNHEFERLYESDKRIDAEDIIKRLKPLITRFASAVTDTSIYLHQAIKNGKRIVFEGAQAALLDLDHGTYPYVTSSNTTIGGVLTGTGLGLKAIGKVVGVAKAYATRVGEGPMLTEGEEYSAIKQSLEKLTAGEILKVMNGEIEDDNYDKLVSRHIREGANEYGATTGRPRRVGWLDLVALKKAVRINGMDELALTRLDCLDGIGKIKVCTAYQQKNGERQINEFPNDQEELIDFEPVYEIFKGWESTKVIKIYKELPKSAKEYLRFIQDFLETPIAMIRNGPKQGDYIQTKDLWR